MSEKDTQSTTTSFFSSPKNNSLLHRLSEELIALPERQDTRGSMEHHLRGMIQLMHSNAETFDNFCTTNIEWIGTHFINQISEYLNSKNETRQILLKEIFVAAFRFLCELEFTQPGDPSFEVREITSFVHENIDKFEERERRQLVYAAYTMPAHIARKLIKHPSISDFRAFGDVVGTAKKLKEDWDKELNQREAMLKALAENIKDTASEYNFVGLVNGFKNLRNQKQSELKLSFSTSWLLAVVMLVVPIAQLAFVLWHLESIDSHKSVLAYSLPALITVEVILFYFFRVVLSQYKSVKAQLLQLDLRISLCQFIESYSEYISRVRKNDTSSLEKFESIIFSGLVAVESGIPSTFDGVDQIASLIKAMRGEGKS